MDWNADPFVSSTFDDFHSPAKPYLVIKHLFSDPQHIVFGIYKCFDSLDQKYELV